MKIAIIGVGVMGKGITAFFKNVGVLGEVLNFNEKEISESKIKNCDIIIEAIHEDFDLKKELFKQLNDVCKEETIFCTNTSSLSVNELAEASGRPERFIGTHFFNPAEKMKLVELICGDKTSPEVFNQVESFLNVFGKITIEVEDKKGFFINKVLFSFLGSVIDCIEDDRIDIKDVDNAIKLGLGFPLGALELMDFIGIDVCNSIFNNLGMPKETLQKMIIRGEFGQKSGKGFYEYEKVFKYIKK